VHEYISSTISSYNQQQFRIKVLPLNRRFNSKHQPEVFAIYMAFSLKTFQKIKGFASLEAFQLKTPLL